MEQQDNQDINYQFLWTVPPQPLVNTHAVVETYQNKIPLDLNISSTDTTAISSFALSVIIALILGCLATWLAYWFGVRSFKLTEMSFKTVSKDIKEAAETNRNTTFELIKSHEILKDKELKAVFKNKWFDEMLSSHIEVSNSLEQWIMQSRSINLLLIQNIKHNPQYKIHGDEYCSFELKKLEDEAKVITYNLKKLRILLNLEQETIDSDFTEKLLDIQISVNVISKNIAEFIDCDDLCRQLYLENIDISNHIANFIRLKIM